MTTTCKSAEAHVAALIQDTNRTHVESTVMPWGYELTTEVHNIGIVVGASSKNLQVNPLWLGFVVEGGDFKACVADEIVAWYLIEEITGASALREDSLPA